MHEIRGFIHREIEMSNKSLRARRVADKVYLRKEKAMQNEFPSLYILF